MKKQGLILGFAAALLGAAFIFTGCESPTDGSAGAAGPVVIPAAVSPSALQAAIDSGAPIIIGDTVVSDDGVVDFKTATVTLNGALSTAANVIFVVAKANVIPGPNASVALGSSGVLIVSDQNPAVSAAGGTVAKTVSADDVKETTSGAVAIENYTLSDTTGDVKSNVTVYVYGTLTVDDKSVVSTGKVVALGTTAVSKNTDAVNETNVSILSGTLTTSGTDPVTVTLPVEARLTAVTSETTGLLTVNGGGTSLDIGSFASAGAVTFAESPTFAGAASFGGNADFTGTATFNGNVTLGSTSVLKLVTATTSTLTLAKGKSIKVGSTEVLKSTDSSTNVLLTPNEANATLTASAGKLTLGGGAATLTTGELTVVAGAELGLNSKDLTVTATTANLVLTGAASNGAKLSGAGNVKLGNAKITGGASGAWQASGADTSIVFAPGTAPAVAITGKGTDAVLKALTDDSAAITLANGNSNGDGVNLSVSNVTIDISEKGAIVFPYVATTAATLVLKDVDTGVAAGALKLGSGTTDTTNVNLTVGNDSLVISGSSIVKKGNSASPPVAGLISGGAAGTNDATITGKTDTTNVTVKAGATLTAGA